MSSTSISRGAPWWMTWLVVGILVFAPGFVMALVDRAGTSLERYGDELPDATSEEQSPAAPQYSAPCDVDAVLDALGFQTVAAYQISRGLYVDNEVGPQTGTALCAEPLPEEVSP